MISKTRRLLTLNLIYLVSAPPSIRGIMTIKEEDFVSCCVDTKLFDQLIINGFYYNKNDIKFS